MVLAGWLKSYSFTGGKGHQVAWQIEGAQKALLLRDLSERFDLTSDDDFPNLFHLACKGAGSSSKIFDSTIDKEVSEFWLMCTAELSLEGDRDGQLAMVHLVTSWAPKPSHDGGHALC
jgi:hypothetical protein